MKIKKGMKKPLIISGIVILTLIVVLVIIFVPKSSNKDSSTSLLDTNLGSNAVLYEEKYVFTNFTDKTENAFTINIPEGWEVSSSSGIIRPYIDAGVLLQAMSTDNRGFIYLSPYGVYTVPNSLLDFAGFTEGTHYDPSGGISTPMLVKKYTEAGDFLNEYVQQLDIETEIIETTERPDLINSNPGPLVTKQSAAEITYTSQRGSVEIKNKLICYIYLVEISGTGTWMASLFGYYSPEALFNETEYLVLKSQESFKVNPEWAKKEAEEINKRLGIISSTQDSISDTISSTFEYRTESQDRINNEWSKTTLGVEEVYNPETGETRYPESGAKYYWMDNKNNIYGTETDENPFPLEDMTKLEIKKEV